MEWRFSGKYGPVDSVTFEVVGRTEYAHVKSSSCSLFNAPTMQETITFGKASLVLELIGSC
jgi:hypothetical protein